MQRYDALIIGGGHNGLVAAAYLAKGGRSVLVLERRPVLGGAAVTEELIPGFRFSTLADGPGMLAPEVIHELALERHGLQIVPADPLIAAPQPDGPPLAIWRDPGRTAREIARFSASDAARYPAFVAMLAEAAKTIAALNRTLPPDVPDLRQADLLALLRLAVGTRRTGPKAIAELLRIMPMSVHDLLNEWFESDALKGVIAASGIAGITFGPRAAGTTYLLLYHAANTGGLFREAGVVCGGMGALSEAVASAARAGGAEIRTDTAVREICVEEDRVTGVRLIDGSEIAARVVLSSADPRTTFERLIDPAHLDAGFRWRAGNIKYRGSAARLHLALDGLPTVKGLDGGTDHLRGHILIAPSPDYLERAYDHIKYGRWSEHPYLDVTIPSLSDPSLAPPGGHTLSITVQYAPYHLRGGDWDSRRDEFADHVIASLARTMPDLPDRIRDRCLITPLDMERVYGLPEGNGSHGEMSLDQFLYMRPVPGYARYRGPLDGLYLCGAGAHPGGGVTGLPGRSAARAVLKALR